MQKRISLSNHTSLKTAAVLLVLAVGVFSSRADHFEWSDPTLEFSGPSFTSGSDPVYQWVYNSSYGGSASADGSTVYWSGGLEADSTIVTDDPFGPLAITTGRSIFAAASLNSEITGTWDSDEDGPAVDATVDYTADISGEVYAKTDVEQSIDPADGFYGDIIYFTAGASAGVDYYIDDTHLPSWVGDGYATVAGGITNGLSTNLLGGGVSYFGPEITPVLYDAEHISADNYEEWIWDQAVDFSIDVSDSYTLDVDDVSINPGLMAAATTDIDLNTKETDSSRVRVSLDATSGINASFSYTVTPNY